MRKTIIILTSIIVLIRFLYFTGTRLSSKDFIHRKITFNKVKNIDCSFWKYAEDEHIVDFFHFDNPDRYRIVNDTLYFGEELEAIFATARDVQKRHP